MDFARISKYLYDYLHHFILFCKISPRVPKIKLLLFQFGLIQG